MGERILVGTGTLPPILPRLTRRAQGFLDAHAAADMLAWENSGFSIDASVRITLNRPRRAELFSVARAPRTDELPAIDIHSL